jgi:malonyl-CoA O-methyltransferase
MAVEVFRAFAAEVETHPEAALKRFDTLQVTGSQTPSRQLLRQLQALRREPASGGLSAGLAWLEALDMRSALSALQQPQLHLLTAQDALVPASVGRCIEAQVAGNPAVTVKVLSHGSHLAPLECPAVLEEELRVFLGATGLLFEHSQAAPELEKKAVAASFSRAASLYDSVAQLQRSVCEQLLTFLDDWPGTPRNMLDLGCGTGYIAPLLQARYPQARYLGLDIASGMVDYARGRNRDDCDWLVGDAEALPLASESIDLIFSSLAVQWCARPEHLLAELARVLSPGGICVFSSLGPGTLRELRAAWATVDSHQHVNTFLPATILYAAVARIPDAQLTLQEQAYCMEYERVRDLLDELKALGAHNMNRSRPSGLTSRRALQGMLQAYEEKRANGVLPATYDVIFGVLKKR